MQKLAESTGCNTGNDTTATASTNPLSFYFIIIDIINHTKE